ncbi:MAG TPA: hypothetical protein VF844_17460 [Ktedonobacteraceae bacterium]
MVSNSYQICGQTLTTVVPTAPRQSSQSVFLSHPDRLSSQVMPRKCWELEPHLARASGSPTTLRAGSSARGPGLPVFVGVSLWQASPTSPVATQGVTRSVWGGVANATR